MLYAEQHIQTEAKDGIYVCFKAFYESFHIKIYVKRTQSNNCKIKKAFSFSFYFLQSKKLALKFCFEKRKRKKNKSKSLTIFLMLLI